MENNKIDTSINFKFDSLEYETAINYFNCSLNNIIDSHEKKELWLRILQLFFYSDKLDEEIILMNKVLTYLYTGKLGDGSSFNPNNVNTHLKNKSRTVLTNCFNDPNFITDLNLKKNFFLALYDAYLIELNKHYIKLNEHCTELKTFDKLLIYEAPPFKNVGEPISHFLLNGKAYLNSILCKNVKITECDCIHHSQILTIYNDLDIDKDKTTTTKYNIDTYNTFIHGNIQKVARCGIVYIDLILVPIKIDPVLRKAWSTDNKFLFGEKQLPVLLFEWAIDHFKHKIRIKRNDTNAEKQLFSNNCLIALGTPVNTSASIYEYFVDKTYKIDAYGDSKKQKTENHIDITQLNSPTAFRKFDNRGKGVVFPLFKSNVIKGGQYPDKLLVKHAFDIK